MEWNQWIHIAWWVVIAIYYFMMFMVSISILLENRTPLQTLSYLLILFLLPVIGIIIYLFFGQNFRKNKLFNRKEIFDSVYIKKFITRQLIQFKRSEKISRKLLQEKYRVVKLLINNSNALLTGKNKVKVLRNGENAFKEIISCMESAKRHIHLDYYMIHPDNIGNQIKDILIKKAKEGVEVRVIYDDVGSRKLKKNFIKALEMNGIEIYPFMPVIFPYFTSKLNYRNHRKLIVIDGRVGFVGGINIHDKYINNGTYKTFWRDTHLKITGDAVRSLQIIFFLNWYFVTKKVLHYDEYYFPINYVTEKTLVQIAVSGPDTDWSSIMQAIFTAITVARKYVYIVTPYFIPDESILTALKTSALSGIDVQIMIPKRSDSLIVHYASLSYLKEMLEAGVRVFQYQRGFIHAKCIIVDDILCTVGSSNMDYRSFHQNFEINAFIYDRQISKELLDDFVNDKKYCRELTVERWNRRAFTKKLIESAARILAPVL